MLLGDYGAEVIKVEHPLGDPARTHGWNRDGHGLWWKVIAGNKQTVTLNLSKPEGRTSYGGSSPPRTSSSRISGPA
jgi:crotonobetainyl-CoA:carnitine CoA-transferase CaiB-like acyl-CoA transferase